MQRLLLTNHTLDSLKKQYTDCSSDYLQQMWEHFLILAENHPFWYSLYSVPAFLVTGEERFRNIARSLFLSFIDNLEDGYMTQQVQMHVHTVTAPMGRLAVMYDWIFDTDLLTDAEKESFSAALLDFANLTGMQQLQGRARAFDNQIFSNSFGVTLVGDVLSRRHPTALARKLQGTGMECLLDQFSRLPSTNYSGEGSTYQFQVVLPLFSLACAYLDNHKGYDIFNNGLAPSHTPVRNWLRTCEIMTGPGGLFPGWDAYGNFHNGVKTPLVYYAMRTGDNSPLELLMKEKMWYNLPHNAWECDDRLWTLMWWPTEREIDPDQFRFKSWMQPDTAISLQDGPKESRAFLYYDETGGLANAGRSQCNPNAIQFDFASVPLLFDGGKGLDTKYININEADLLSYTPEERIKARLRAWPGPDTPERQLDICQKFIAGGISESNSLVFNDEQWYVPLNPVNGIGKTIHDIGSIKVGIADATAFYTDRYDVSKVERSIFMIDGQSLLCLDNVSATSGLRIGWQIFTWPGVVNQNDCIVVDAGGEVELQLYPGQPGSFECDDIDHFVMSPCEACKRITFNAANCSKNTTLSMLLHAQKKLALQLDISEGWTVNGLEKQNLNNFYLSDESKQQTQMSFVKELTLPDQEDLFLKVRFATPMLKAFLNGQELEPYYQQGSMAPIKNESHSLPFLFRLSNHIPNRTNRLELRTEHHHGESILGPIEILQSKETETPCFTRHNGSHYELKANGKEWELFIAPEHLETDATHLLQGKTEQSFCHTTFINNGDLALKSTQAIDISLNHDRIEFGELAPNTIINLKKGEGFIHIYAMDSIFINGHMPEQTTLYLSLDAPRHILFNGQDLGKQGGTGSRDLTIPLPLTQTLNNLDIDENNDVSVYELAEKPTANLADSILQALQSKNWRVQMAGADVAGRLAVGSAVQPLIDILTNEMHQYLPLKKSWCLSKMNMALNAPEEEKQPDTEFDRDYATKWYRLTRACATALGLIGDPKAIPVLTHLMDQGTDFFPALSQVPLALARLNAKDAITVLEKHNEYHEINVKMHVHLALKYLKGEIDLAAFEKQANPV